VGRYGGEEFLVVLPGCDADDAALQGERVREAIGGFPFLALSQPVAVTASLGVACSSRCLPESLVREADDALYLAKAGGRNMVVMQDQKWGHTKCCTP
jgi:diguanylate cyclase (GGDEF)-like protein